ncbi:hypothetical protein [Priestia taiwanensis]|uniref:Uncharacterized protein n=1 Tax=Priestia taiwanensis TaxID=1347902 RepID=A0A917AUQ5_9BACI|nr:hypothetical protein [Priestia taiwanensis]MBM7363567.1 glycosyltransferase involved in cell wall biosynthesis [Priestia taiwanensis]GGE76022.1 hypothetical protein GCM10007140_27220 [Priestia taiwanensis]
MVKDSDVLAVAIEDAYEKKEGELRESGDRLYERATTYFSLESLRKETVRYYKEIVR